ncbi:hypothetical protein SNE40_004006 [Patella caerulea]|uniref:Sulfotransferase domain-containing protein n=1 Tax=Patella caerulea TaxID=87958 RepID=A0AAN8Q0V9_PATCE
MALVKIPDAAGETINFIEFKGRLYPNFSISSVEAIPNFKVREDDIFLIAYPKSGSHWLWEVCRMLVAGTVDVKVRPKQSMMLELASHEEIDQEPSPRVLNSHLRYDELPKDFKKFNNKIIYIRRNLKDIAVSFYNHTLKFYDYYQYKGEWKNYLKMVLDGKVDYNSWFDFVLHWEDVIATHQEFHILELTYEDMIECPHREFKKIAEFLEVPFDDKLLADAVHKCSFKSMKKRKGHFYVSPEGDSAVYRKGEVGDWKNWFTVAQNEWFDQIYDEKMAASKLMFKYSK